MCLRSIEKKGDESRGRVREEGRRERIETNLLKGSLEGGGVL